MKDHIRERIVINLWAAYAGIAVMTFGSAFNSYIPSSKGDFQDMERTWASLMCAAVWPLYWSVQLQKQ